MFDLNKYLIILCILISIVEGLFEKECDNEPFREYVSHPNYCTKYIYCTGTEGLEGDCPNDDYFDSLTSTCNRPDQVDCVDTPIEDPNSSSSSAPTSTTTSTTSTTSTTTTTTTTTIAPLPSTTIEVIETCPIADDPKEIVYLKSPTSQSDYFICYHGQPMQMSCTSKLYFNLMTKKCELIENGSDQEKTTTQSFTDCNEHMKFYPHPSKCEFFFYCLNGHTTLQQCPLFYQWDIKKESCQLPHIAQCVRDN